MIYLNRALQTRSNSNHLRRTQPLTQGDGKPIPFWHTSKPNT